MGWKKKQEDESLFRVLPAESGIRRQRGEDVRPSSHFVISFVRLRRCCVIIMHILPMCAGSTRRFSQAGVCGANWPSCSMQGECRDLKVCLMCMYAGF